MPRKIRFFLPGVPVHVVQRGNNREAVFFCADDYGTYLDWLREEAAGRGCVVHAYALMTNHIHLLMTPRDRGGLSDTLQALGRRFVPRINHAYARSGTLWEGRFKASPVQEDAYLLACYRYIELNPVRAGMVADPGGYPWSSYRANALGQPDPLLVPHPLYLALGATDAARQAAYRELFETGMEPATLKEIRACLQTGTPLGNDRFREQIERALGVKVGYAARGRPKKVKDEPLPDDQLSLDL
jgi:putative transposase